MKGFGKVDMLDMACEKYVEILQNAVRKGYTNDPAQLVSLFLGLGIAQNVLYQKLVDLDCTVEEIERAKEKVDAVSREIIASVKGKFTIPPTDEKV